MKKKSKPWSPVLHASPYGVEKNEYEKVLDEISEIIYLFFRQQIQNPKTVAIESQTHIETLKGFRKSGSK